ncbi:uncharacterized protein RCC_05925 [Ramularia collo-cygni]|uniref:Uncharacterized protein n=1 Tax=Ramularia collo-cygni TaxID=112498 RepID=A0A2D3UXC0_9PEZI|nr:uncharacterized protein RCC_05925 [Ramularia collo-cygni]CZT20068.1 uncharacterized protein RCC_05925 [Ramularia collo-cygni]
MEAMRSTLLRPKTIRIAIASLFTIVVVFLLAPTQTRSPYKPDSWTGESTIGVPGHIDSSSVPQPKVHILLLATKGNVKLCKTLLTLAILGYPTPRIISWGGTDSTDAMLGGGSHFGKITKTIEYIDKYLSEPGSQDDLILMLDAFDIWLQLPLEVLLTRYKAILEEDDARIAHRMGRAFALEEIKSGIVFGAGKRCGPNSLHTVACYPVPESPLPKDLYGITTDTPIGHTDWSSFRTRYLNAGTTIGPVKMLRPVLERAHQKLLECRGRQNADFDAGTGVSDFCYHGSDQSIWMEIFGEQEFQREVMRRHHRSNFDTFAEKFNPHRAGSQPPSTQVYGVPILDYLEPGFYHQPGEKKYRPAKPDEFGISLDYWSGISHQTSNTYWDANYIRKDQLLEDQIGKRNGFDCQAKPPNWRELSDDLLSTFLPGERDQWNSMPFYTEYCVGRIPPIIHHNSFDKTQIDLQWNRTWWHGHSRALLEQKRSAGLPMLVDGIPTDAKNTTLQWEELCPAEYDAALF